MKRRISGKKFLQDVRDGLTDVQLMEKYRIKPVTLQYIFRKLLQEGFMTHLEFYARSELRESELFAAFSDESEGYLRCPQCGQPMPDWGGECPSCESINLTVKSLLPTEISDRPVEAPTNPEPFETALGRKTQFH
jgi:rubrerythrin